MKNFLVNNIIIVSFGQKAEGYNINLIFINIWRDKFYLAIFLRNLPSKCPDIINIFRDMYGIKKIKVV